MCPLAPGCSPGRSGASAGSALPTCDRPKDERYPLQTNRRRRRGATPSRRTRRNGRRARLPLMGGSTYAEEERRSSGSLSRCGDSHTRGRSNRGAAWANGRLAGCLSSALVSPQGAPGGPERLGTPRGRGRVTARPTIARMLKPAAFKAADSTTAFEHPGGATKMMASLSSVRSPRPGNDQPRCPRRHRRASCARRRRRRCLS